jgi:hypothetical protein
MSMQISWIVKLALTPPTLTRLWGCLLRNDQWAGCFWFQTITRTYPHPDFARKPFRFTKPVLALKNIQKSRSRCSSHLFGQEKVGKHQTSRGSMWCFGAFPARDPTRDPTVLRGTGISSKVFKASGASPIWPGDALQSKSDMAKWSRKPYNTLCILYSYIFVYIVYSIATKCHQNIETCIPSVFK